ncbi:hypothetical protein RSAG8_13847, partial [Rhizoctonia solani AG-8 WAC10335]
MSKFFFLCHPPRCLVRHSTCLTIKPNEGALGCPCILHPSLICSRSSAPSVSESGPLAASFGSSTSTSGGAQQRHLRPRQRHWPWPQDLA